MKKEKLLELKHHVLDLSLLPKELSLYQRPRRLNKKDKSFLKRQFLTILAFLILFILWFLICMGITVLVEFVIIGAVKTVMATAEFATKHVFLFSAILTFVSSFFFIYKKFISKKNKINKMLEFQNRAQLLVEKIDALILELETNKVNPVNIENLKDLVTLFAISINKNIKFMLKFKLTLKSLYPNSVKIYEKFVAINDCIKKDLEVIEK